MDETLSIIPIVAGLVEVAKRTGLPVKFAWATSVVLGIVLAAAWDGVSPKTIVVGIVYGLSAAGLYDGSKQAIALAQKQTGADTPPTP